MPSNSASAGEAAAKGQAIALMCAGLLCLSVNDAIAKWFTQDYHPLQILFIRQALALPMVFAAALALRGTASLKTVNLRVHALRGLLLVGAATCNFLGLRYLPLAEATTLILAAPFFITALSAPLLGEQVGWRRWSAVLIGFLGVLIVVRPGIATFQPAAIYVLAAALLYALIMLSARWIDRGEGFWTMVFYFTLFATIFSGLGAAPFWQPLNLEDLPLYLVMAVAGTLGITLISQAFRLGPAAVVAPFEYSILLWASLLGWLVWQELPDLWTYLGAAVIAASGSYIVLRETRRKTAQR
ncbi:MAG: DMT family transporter [Rhodovibrionaceae bacterium]